MSDGMSNIIGIIGITIAVKPVDKKHPYGHKKSEVIASLFIGAMLFVLGIKIFMTGLDRFMHLEELNITTISLFSSFQPTIKFPIFNFFDYYYNY